MKKIIDTVRQRQLVLCIALLTILAACNSCVSSNNALKNHSLAAQSLDDIAAGAKETVLELRAVALGDAVAGAKASNLNDTETEQRVIAAAAAFDAGPAIPAVNAFVAAKDVYVRTVLAVAAKDKPTWDELKPILQDVITAYEAMRAALGNPSKLPALPEAISKLLSRLDPPPGERVASTTIGINSQPEVV